MATRQVLVESYGLPMAVDVHERVSGRTLLHLAGSPRYAKFGLRAYVDVATGEVHCWTAGGDVHRCVASEMGLPAKGPAFTVRRRPVGLLVAPSRDGADVEALWVTTAGAYLRGFVSRVADEFDADFLTDEEMDVYRALDLVDANGNLDFRP